MTLSVVHLNHGWRGEQSDADERFVAGIATSFGLPFHSHSMSVGPTEDDARQARRQYFGELRTSGLVDLIATGHTLDDQAENRTLPSFARSQPFRPCGNSSDDA